MDKQGDLIFTLDIGTRTVIGLIMENIDGNFKILASYVVEHEERAMLDGQIHNVSLVAKQVQRVKNKLEEISGIELERVSIAAAGRALKTINYEATLELDERRIITEEDVQSLEFSAIQKAQSKLAVSPDDAREIRDYHFVGHTVQEYNLDGIVLRSLEGQSGKNLRVKIIATFLPRIVVDSLLTVINRAGLEVEYLTLEPIAVANVVIPKDMYNFNLALVDIGAGTSDIAITKGGAMLAYAMVPIAGDEITEAIAEHYLLDYKTGERIKRSLMTEEEITVRNILSQEVNVSSKKTLEAISPIVQTLASQISEAILMYNEKPPQAVICVGGGSLTPNIMTEIAGFLELDPARVAIKEYTDIENIEGELKGVSNAQASTPIGIALSSSNNKGKASFIDVYINNVKHQLFTLNKATVADALLAAEVDYREIQSSPGMGLTCTVNGKLKVIKGEVGEPGKIIYNGQEINDLELAIESGACIDFYSGKQGKDARAIIADIIPELEAVSFRINQEEFILKPEIYQNGELVNRDSELKDGAEIIYDDYSTIRDVIAKVYNRDRDDLTNDFVSYTINGESKFIPQGDLLVLHENKPVDLDIPLEENMNLKVIEKENKGLSSKEIINSQMNESISIIFNGSQLRIPIKGKLYYNGEKIEDSNLEIKNGDNISYQQKTLTVKSVFEYLNYKVTPYLKNFRLNINGKLADFDQEVKDGDRIELLYKKEI
ncbi:MAG: cell division FtsA domain-containing protein [Halanaerobiaceae bacterium]